MYAPSQSPQFVLIDTLSERNVDRDVVPAAIEFVVSDVISKRFKGETLPGSVCLLSIDGPVRYFEKVSRRGVIPKANVLDCYTNWYKEWIPATTSDRDASIQTAWHFASTSTPEESARVFIQAVKRSFENTQISQSQGRIVVIDSLSSVLSLSPSLDAVLHLLDSLSNYNTENGNSNSPITLVATIRSSQLKPPLFEGLRKLATTHVLVEQLSLKQKAKSLSDLDCERGFLRMSVSKRKVSGRMHFEEHALKMDWDNVQLHIVEGGLESVYSLYGQKEQDNKREDTSLELAQRGLSFRVTLSSKEREVRAAAGLPYLHTDEELANSALISHPENLRVRETGVGETERDSSDSSDAGSDEEDLFSEDV